MRPSLRQTVDQILAEFNAKLNEDRRNGLVEELTDDDIIEVDHYPYTTMCALGEKL